MNTKIDFGEVMRFTDRRRCCGREGNQVGYALSSTAKYIEFLIQTNEAFSLLTNCNCSID